MFDQAQYEKARFQPGFFASGLCVIRIRLSHPFSFFPLVSAHSSNNHAELMSVDYL